MAQRHLVTGEWRLSVMRIFALNLGIAMAEVFRLMDENDIHFLPSGTMLSPEKAEGRRYTSSRCRIDVLPTWE